MKYTITVTLEAPHYEVAQVMEWVGERTASKGKDAVTVTKIDVEASSER